MDNRAAGDSMPDPLREALRDHADGAELEQVWALLPVAEQSAPPHAARTAQSREDLWQRIAARTVSPSAGEAQGPRDGAPVVSLDARRAAKGHAMSNSGRAADRGRSMRMALLSAAALLVVSLTWSLRDITTRTAAGQTTRLTLADGSHVTLGGSSTLRHPRWIRPAWLGGGTRQIQLAGVAFFDVAKDAVRPFSVKTAQATIRVVGTRFNVVARGSSNAASTDVAVEEGVVEVRRAKGTDASPAILRANDRIRVPAGAGALPTVTSGVDVSRETAWIQGGFSAVELPFTALIAMLEAQYGVEITLTGSAASTEAMTVYYPTQRQIDAILLDLCTARGLMLRRTSRGFDIAPPR